MGMRCFSWKRCYYTDKSFKQCILEIEVYPSVTLTRSSNCLKSSGSAWCNPGLQIILFSWKDICPTTGKYTILVRKNKLWLEQILVGQCVLTNFNLQPWNLHKRCRTDYWAWHGVLMLSFFRRFSQFTLTVQLMWCTFLAIFNSASLLQ